MAIENLKIAFFIQARMGSNRLPGKVLMPFDGDKSILEIITSKIKANFKEIPLVICTSEAQIDDEIISFCDENNLDYYRGSEQNVLQRFLDAAAFYNVDIIIRVCADNPFLSVDFLNELLAYFYKNQDADYWSFKNAQEIPVIKTHFGFFAEIVTKEALQKVIQKIKEVLSKSDNYAHIDLLLENIRRKVDNFKRIALSTSEGIHLFEISDIIRCESEDNYTKFYIKNSKPILISKTLKEYEDLLTEHGFERIHQSHLINLAYLKSYIKKDGGYVVMADNSNLPISQRKRERLQELLKTM